MDNIKRVFITGANSGIGYAAMLHFSSLNYEVTAIDKSFTQTGIKNVEQVILNLHEHEKVEQWLKNHCQQYDVIINCAGIREICALEDLSFNTWRNVMSVNIDAAFLISKHFAIQSKLHSSSLNIINISSISGLQAEPKRNAYISSKHALIGLTKAMALELGEHNIRVNAIAPGIIETELTQPYFSNKEKKQLILNNTPLKKWGKPEHIIKTIDFLIDNNYITGETIVVDGGWTIGKDL